MIIIIVLKKNFHLNGAMGFVTVGVGIEAKEEEKEEKEEEINNIEEVTNFYYKIKQILLEQNKSQPINYGSLDYFINKKNKKNKKNKTKPIRIPFSNSN
jgi:hypothetical protein